MAIRYEWHGDKQYYSTVVDRYYAQVPVLFRLRSQALILWLALAGPLLSIDDLGIQAKGLWLALVTAFALTFAPLIRWAIVGKYILRPSYGSKTTFVIDSNDVVVIGVGAGRFPWTVYERAVRFSDGILLIRRGAIRWLPNTALSEGTVGDALDIVRERLPLRVLSSEDEVAG